MYHEAEQFEFDSMTPEDRALEIGLEFVRRAMSTDVTFPLWLVDEIRGALEASREEKQCASLLAESALRHLEEFTWKNTLSDEAADDNGEFALSNGSTGNPGCDECGVEDAVVKIDGKYLCITAATERGIKRKP